MGNNNQHPNCIMLTSRNVNESIAFYRDICGFEMTESWPDPENPMWANLVLDGQSVMVGGAVEPDQVAGMCEGEPKEEAWHKGAATDWQGNAPGVGAYFYIVVDDVDAYHAEVVGRGGKPATDPKSQFYGLRCFGIQDPSGYRFLFYSPIVMENCGSCGMPLVDAEPGQTYCDYCTDDEGKLKPYEEVLEGTIQGYFMGMQKMERAEAEVAAKDHLAQMPAWNPDACG